ncbi:MAG: hypothetical protein IKC56_01125 [Clostridia bacterium]|nr:hypothetical protein [Clostridia bacterium]
MVADKQLASQRLTAQKAAFLTMNTAKQTETQTAKTNAITKERNKWENVISDLDAQAEKRGMQKSAWYLSKRLALFSAKDEAVSSVGQDYDKKIAQLVDACQKEERVYDAELAVAQSAYESALQEKKLLLKKEQEERGQAITEFNNGQALKEAQYNLQAQQFVFERANEETVTRTSMMFDKLEACYAYLGNFTNSQAFNYVKTDDIYHKYLGSYGYDALYERYELLCSQ